MRTEEASISACIVTRNRVDLLRQCLLSVGQSTVPVKQIIVSDDSTDDRTYRMVSSQFEDVQYLKGPKKGPGANRNNAVIKATSEYVLFLDDDACLGESFLEEALGCLTQSSNPRRAIVTGLYTERGELIYPHEQSFLGFQSVDCANKQVVNALSISSVLFPRGLFDEIRFEEMSYYDEIDLATRASSRGFDILLCKSAINRHYPPNPDKDVVDSPLANASRIYVTYKRYAYTEGNPIKGVIYLLVATVHVFLSAIKRGGLASVPNALETLKISYDYIRHFTRLPEGVRRWIN
jgi:GT2 family glycosyltransferase